MPFIRQHLTSAIADRLNLLAHQVKTHSRAGFTDANRTLEIVLARVLNVLFDWELENLNAESARSPAVDLGDRNRRIAVQITNEESWRKVKTTTELALKLGLDKNFDRLIVFFLLSRKPETPDSFLNQDRGLKIETWDIADLRRLMQGVKSLSALDLASRILQEEMGSSASNVSRISMYQLPPRPFGFVGREDEIHKLCNLKLASGVALCCLRGMGGIGKSALAIVVAHVWKSRFPDAQVFIDARGTHREPPPPSELLAQIIQTFLPTVELPTNEAALTTIYRDVLKNRKVLIVLDNARDAGQANPLIPPKGCGLIVTTRSTFLLGKTAPHRLERLSDDSARALLREGYFLLSDEDALELVEHCSGLPLALRLASAHLALDAVERAGQPNVELYLLALRNGRLAVLDKGASEAGEIAISETLRLSEAQLRPTDRRAWRKLRIFTASFDSRAAQAVAGIAQPILDRFVRLCILEREQEDRYKLHDLVADYIRSKNPGSHLELAHALHYGDIGSEAEKIYVRSGAVDGLSMFDRERPHFEAAIAWLLPRTEEASSRAFVHLFGAIGQISVIRFHPLKCVELCEHHLVVSRKMGDTQSERRILIRLGTSYRRLGQTQDSIRCWQQSLELARRDSDRKGEGNALGNIGRAQRVLGHLHEAVSSIGQSLAIVREIGDRTGEAKALCNLGTCYLDLAENERAVSLCEQSLNIFQSLNDSQGTGVVLGLLGILHRRLGSPGKAVRLFEQQLAIAREMNDPFQESNALGNLGHATLDLGDVQKAKELYQQALPITKLAGHRAGEAMLLNSLGELHSVLQDPSIAVEFYRDASDIFKEIGYRQSEGNAAWSAAQLYNELLNRQEAVIWAAHACSLLQPINPSKAEEIRLTLEQWQTERVTP